MVYVLGLRLLCSEITYYASWNCSNFVAIVLDFVTPQSIMLLY